jgi:hypothetical protein
MGPESTIIARRCQICSCALSGVSLILSRVNPDLFTATHFYEI